MTFLNPFVLLGLAAASIPLILHLLNLRKLRTIEFSSIRFLQELQKTRIRKLKIRQWLLLLIRTLLIIALVIAFARPALTGSVADIVGTRAATTMVIMVDDSPSMAIRSDQGQLFTLARNAAARLLTLAHQGDLLYVLPLSDLRHSEHFPPAPIDASSHEVVDRLTLSHETVPYVDAVRAAETIAASTSSANQECYIIGDAQATQFRTAAIPHDTSTSADRRLKTFILEVPHQPPDNAGISEVAVRSQIIARNKPVLIRAKVWNAGSSPLQHAVISAYLRGTRVAQQAVDIASRATSTVDFTVVPKYSGIQDGYLQLEGDSFEEDNRRWYVLDVPDSLNILLVGGNIQDTKLASLALLPGGDPFLAGLFRVRTVVETQLPSIDFAAVDVVVSCDVHDFSDIEAERISQFVRSGGGLAVFPGPSSDIHNYNQTLFPRLGIPPLSQPEGMGADSATASAGSLSFDRIDFAHPVLAELFERTSGTAARSPAIESPAIRRSVGMSAGPSGKAVVTLPNGHDFLDEHNSGTGRIFIFAVDAGLAWSDFAIKGIFAPLLHRSMIYLSAVDRSVRSFTTGEEIEFTPKLEHRSEDDTYMVKNPAGVDERVAPRRSSSTGLSSFSTSASREPGIYELDRVEPGRGAGVESHRIAAVAVNIDPGESDLRPVSNDELTRFWTLAGIDPDRGMRLASDEPLLRKIEQSRFGVELWRYFLGLAILLAITEMILGRAPTQAVPPDNPET